MLELATARQLAEMYREWSKAIGGSWVRVASHLVPLRRDVVDNMTISAYEIENVCAERVQ